MLQLRQFGLNIIPMKNLRSISELKMKYLNHPQILTLKQECQGLWHESYYSSHAIWYMLAALLLMTGFLVQWMTQQYRMNVDYTERLSILTQQGLYKPVHQTTQLGGERLFGQPMSISAQQALMHAFKLEGILYDGLPKKRSAVIKDMRGEVKFYHQGEVLPGGAKLVNIAPDYIEIEAQGFVQKLKLERYPASFLSDEPINSGNHLLND
jgi:type II secretory pathway component PulC